MRVALVTPRILGVDGNPGWWMITNGIRNLVLKAIPDAQFLVADMIEDNPVHWAAAATCDVAIMCGNPRFTLSHDSWWEGPIWHRLLQLQAAGCRVIDGWSGAAHALSGQSLADMATAIRTLPRNVTYLQYAAAISGRITRDPLMQEIYTQAGVTSVQLPCSSWWAGVRHGRRFRSRCAVSVLSLPRRWDVAWAIARACPGWDVLASTWEDYLWARGGGLDPILANDPDTLLRMYETYDRVLSFRIHAAIPAAAVGCSMHVVAVDTRAEACAAFELPVTPLEEFVAGAELYYATAWAPDEAAVLATFKEMLYGNDPDRKSRTHAGQLDFAF